MSAAAAGAGAAMARSRRRVIDSFKEQGAFAPHSAIAFHPLRAIDERQFGRLLNKGVILPADGRRFYLDAAALMAADKSRGRVKTVALTSVGALAVATLAAVLFGAVG